MIDKPRLSDDPMLSEDQEHVVMLAERKIQRILNDLEEKTRLSVDYVNVDTHNFCQLRTEIFLTKKQRI